MAQIEEVEEETKAPPQNGPLNIAILHPDLGIGGAERLIVDASLGLQQRGHKVTIYTSHHDPKHSFEETNDGTLKVVTISSPFPRAIFGGFHIYMAIFGQLHLLVSLLFGLFFKSSQQPYDVFIVDQLSACVPFLRWITGRRVVFYCHFPDKLLAGGKEAAVEETKVKAGLVKTLYRGPADWLEERSTGYSDVLLANSKFTAQVFKRTFPSIQQDLEVVYPGVNLPSYQAPLRKETPDVTTIKSYVESHSSVDLYAEATLSARFLSTRPTLVSLNRFEQKKNVKLALDATSLLLKSRAATDPKLKGIRLVLAGGYDPRVIDNVETLTSLIEACKTRSVTWTVVTNNTSPLPKIASTSDSSITPATAQVTFLLNFTTAQRQYLLRSPNTIALLYTPGNEHFGIGPVEAMACGLPVIACPTGGPTESIIDVTASSPNGTGWLRRPDPVEWADALQQIIALPATARTSLSIRSKARVQNLFSMERLAQGFERALKEAVEMGEVDDAPVRISDIAAGVIVALCFGGWWYLSGKASFATLGAAVVTVVGLGTAIRGTVKANEANE